MRIKGQTISDAFQEWVKDDLKSITKQYYDLGKFIFSVSVGTIGFITAVEKYASVKPDTAYFIATILLIIATIISIIAILPKRLHIEENTDLQDLFENRIKKSNRLIIIWFSIWLSALVLGLVGFFVV